MTQPYQHPDERLQQPATDRFSRLRENVRVTNTEKKDPRYDTLHKEITHDQILAGNIKPQYLPENAPEIQQYRTIMGNNLRAFELTLDIALTSKKFAEIGIPLPEEMMRVFTAAKNPHLLSPEETSKAYGTALEMITLLPPEIKEISKRLRNNSDPIAQDKAVKLTFFLAKALLARDNLRKENPNIALRKSAFDTNTAHTLVDSINGEAMHQLYDEQVVTSIKNTLTEQIFSPKNKNIRARIDQQKRLLIAKPNIDGMGMPFVTAVKKLAEGAPPSALLTEEIQAIRDTAQPNSKHSPKNISTVFRNWEKKGLPNPGNDDELDNAIIYSAALELGKNAKKILDEKLGGTEERNAFYQASDTLKGVGVSVDPDRARDYKHTGNLAGRVATPGGLAAYYVGLYGGAMTLLLNLIASYQSDNWGNPYLALGGAMVYGGVTYLDGKWELPWNHKSPAYRLVQRIRMNETDSWIPILEVFSDIREMRVLRAMNLDKGGEKTFKRFKRKISETAKTKRMLSTDQKRQGGEPPSSGKEWHTEKGKISDFVATELSPDSLMEKQYEGFFQNNNPPYDLLRQLPNQTGKNGRNAARFKAIEYLLSRGIPLSDLPALMRHARGVLSAQTR